YVVTGSSKKLSCGITRTASELYPSNPVGVICKGNRNSRGRARGLPRQHARQRLVDKDAHKDVVSETIVLDQHAISRDGVGAARAWYDRTASRAINPVTVKDLDTRYLG